MGGISLRKLLAAAAVSATALLTTAAGLAVAMPASVVLSWLDSRLAAERALADHALGVVLRPDGQGATQGRAVPDLA